MIKAFAERLIIPINVCAYYVWFCPYNFSEDSNSHKKLNTLQYRKIFFIQGGIFICLFY